MFRHLIAPINRTVLIMTTVLAVPDATAVAQTTFNWINTSGGSYHTNGNWTPGGGPPVFDDFARFGLSSNYGVSFSNNGTQTIDFQVRGGNVTFAFLNSTAQHLWGSGSTNYVGPQAGDAASSATLNLTSMFFKPMQGNNLVIGNTAGKTGTLNIHSNGHWKSYASGNVVVGQVGTGNLNISTVGILEKSALEAFNITIGQSGGTATATVSGLNASMLANNVLTVGDGAGTLGTLTISDQGKVTAADSLFIGVNSNLANTLSVTGGGSELVLGSDVMSIGFAGNGKLLVENGGKVTNSQSGMLLGTSNGSGTLNVSGTGSHFLAAGTQSLDVGSSGTGTVSVSNGALMEVSRMQVALAASSSGTVNVAGAGSVLNLHGALDNQIGIAGTGHVSVSNNGVLNSNAALRVGTSGLGSMTIGKASR